MPAPSTRVLPDAYYVRSTTSPDELESTLATVGPWGTSLQHGGPPAALLGASIEKTLPRPGARVAHFALDFLAAAPVAPVRVSTEVLRPGKKIEQLGATASIGGRPVLRATAWRIATAEGRAPEANTAERPPPLPAAEETRLFTTAPSFGYGLSIEWRFADGGFHVLGPATAWTRLRVAIVHGEQVTPLGRVLAMVDSANGISAELDPATYLFVPVNLTVSLTREAEGEWVGMQAKTRIAAEGVGTTHARLFDVRGFLGESLQTLYVERRF
jgi:acyl-Coa thioesterase superfamily protein/acyl-CoA thioesterase superfamily protein